MEEFDWICPRCEGTEIEFAERWDGGIDPPYAVMYCKRPLCGWEEEV